MRFSPAFLDEIRMRVRLSEVIGRKVSLKTHGRGEYTGLCPFHKEKTPSFTVSDEKNFYHCFGCGAHGDVIRFLVDSNGLNFVEAVTQLASEAGMSLPADSKNDNESHEKFDQAYLAMDLACKWYQQQLELAANSEAKYYLTKRGLSQNTIATFRIGYSPLLRDGLKNNLIKNGISEETMLDVGLIVKKEDGSSFDRFRGRIMFPIMDAKGRVIAFGGRIIGQGEPKYLNSPETHLFKKGYVLYNWHNARQVAYDKSNIAVVEGYMDVIALYQAGIKNVVAPLGTALTENHLKQLWKVVKEPVLCMDGDNAGKRAMYRAATNHISLLQPGYSIKFAMLPAGQDPDDIVKNQGLADMRSVLADSMPLSEIIWEFETTQSPLDTPEQKADLHHRLMKLVATIGEKNVQEQYRHHFNQKMRELNNNYNYSAQGRKKQQPVRLTSLKIPAQSEESEKQRYETMLLKLIINFPFLLDDSEVENVLLNMEFTKSKYNEIRDAIIEIHSNNDNISEEILLKHLETLEFSIQIEHIKSCKFIESFAKKETPREVIKSEYSYVVALHNLCSTEEEYENFMKLYQNEVTEQNLGRVVEFQKQITEFKLAIEKEKRTRELLLDE